MKNYLEKIYKNSKKDFYEEISTKLSNNQKAFIITANPETLMIASKNYEFNKILLSNDVTIIPDGIGIIKAGKMLKINFVERIPGIEVVEELLIKCNDLSKSIFIYGSKQEVINKFATNIKNKYPNIKVVGLRNGYTTNKSKVIEKIKNSDTDIILVGLGIPNQELFINEIYQEYSKGIFIGVGGSLDVLSGYKKRAPKIFVKLNLEWLYRIIKEPSRIKRFYKNNILFFIKIIKLKFSR